MKNGKYETLPELVNALHEHKIPRDKLHVTIDNDSVTGHIVHDEDWTDVEDIFEIHPDDLIQQALTLLGVPWEHV